MTTLSRLPTPEAGGLVTFSSLTLCACPESLVEQARINTFPFQFQPFSVATQKDRRTFSLLHSATLLRTWVIAADGDWNTSLLWSKWIILWTSSSRTVRPHGKSIWIPCGANSFLMCRRLGLPLTPTSCIWMSSASPICYTLLDDRAELPPPECFENAMSPQQPPSALPILLPSASDDATSSGLVGVSIIGCGTYGLSPALMPRLQRSPSTRRREFCLYQWAARP